MMPLPPPAVLFPYTTLFRSAGCYRPGWSGAACESRRSRCLRRNETVTGAGGAVPSIRLAKRFRFGRSEEHTSELQSRGHLVCRLLLEKKKTRERERQVRHGN